MSIVRRKRTENYTIIPNHIWADEYISFEAKALLTYLLTRPDTWTVRISHLKTILNCGRDKCQRIVGELVERGYIERRATQENGLFTGQELVVFDEIDSELPDNYGVPENQADGENTVCLKNRLTEKPSDGKQGCIVSTDLIVNTDTLISTDVDDAKEAFNQYNDFAKTNSWPLCQSQNKTRVSAIKKRLKECGGLTGWNLALRTAAASDFLSNREGAGFVNNIDFMLRASSFTKLMEGNYNNRNKNKSNGRGLSVVDLALEGINE